jgi:predicted PurR-regulated permease PerM
VFNAVLGFVFSLYVLASKEKLGANLCKTLTALLPEKKVERVTEIAALSDKTFTNFVTGQLTEALVIGALCFIGMLIFGMPYAVVVSVLVGFTALIPVFGAFIGTGVGAFLILMVDPMKALWFVVFIIVLQQLEGNLIYPRVVGKSVGLPGLLVLAAVTVGSGVGGILGMLLAVPVCSVIFTVCAQAIDARLAQKEADGMPSSDPIPQTEEAPTAPAAELPTVSAPAAVSHPQTKKKKKKK